MALDTPIQALKQAKFKLEAELEELHEDGRRINTEMVKVQTELRQVEQRMHTHEGKVHLRVTDLKQVERAIKVLEKEQADDLDD